MQVTEIGKCAKRRYRGRDMAASSRLTEAARPKTAQNGKIGGLTKVVLVGSGF